MKSTKRFLSFVLVAVMLLTMILPASAASKEEWAKLWSSDDANAGIIMFVGSDESERNFSWYSEKRVSPM